MVIKYYIKEFLCFLLSTFGNGHLLFDLIKRDFRQRYLGSYLGILWAFIHPLVMILIFWFVFQVGFKSRPVDDFPFVLWLVAGYIPWLFFSDSLGSSTNVILENSYLVKNIVFRVSILPIVKILSALVIHIFFLFVILIMFFLYGYFPDIYNIQVIYYLFAMIILLLGLSWITSSLMIFFRDTGQLVSILLQFGFWLTPVIWSSKIVPARYHYLIRLNPMFYIVEGYRNSFIYHIWFWENYKNAIYFWIMAIIIFFIGAFMFRKLRPHFADVI